MFVCFDSLRLINNLSVNKTSIDPYSSQTSTPSTSNDGAITELAFSSKGLHVANLNVRHLLSKFDEIGIVLASENGHDILGMCETVLDSSTPDNLISVTNYEYLRKDRRCTINKAGAMHDCIYVHNTVRLFPCFIYQVYVQRAIW